MSRLIATAKLARRATRTTRTEVRRLSAAQKGSWRTRVSILGFDDERREEIVARLEEVMGTPRGPKIGDGTLYMHLEIFQQPLTVAAIGAVSHMSDMLHKAGVTPQELNGKPVILEVTPEPDMTAPPEPNVFAGAIRKRLAARANNLYYGLTVAGAESQGTEAYQANGPQTILIEGAICDLRDGDSQPLIEAASRIGATARATGEIFPIRISCEEVGSGLSAMLLAVRSLSSVIQLAPTYSSLRFATVGLVDEAQ